MTNTPIHTHTDDRSELLSGYLDRALDVAAQRQAERTVAECSACAEELADLRALQTMLRALPAPMPRRSFTIDPATVRPRRLLFPVFRFASLAAAMLLLIVIGIDISVGTPAQPMMEAKQDSAAGGVAAIVPQSSNALTEEAAPEPPIAAVLPPGETSAAANAAPAEAPAITSDATAAAESAPAANAPATTSEGAYPAPADPATASDANATAAADQMMDTLDAPEGESGLAPREDSTTVAGGADLRQSGETASGDTDQLTTATEAYAPPIDLWRNLAIVLLVFAVVFGGAWWWTARRGV